ncbi:mesoderm induction early response protein 2 isoform X2 [Amia ocellicauda]
MGSGDHRFSLAAILSHSYGLREEEGPEGHKSLEELEKSLGDAQESEMPLEELLALYGYEASDPISEQDSEAHEPPPSLPDMTLDKEQIAKDLLSGEEEETQSSADDLTPSVTSHASDLFPHHLRGSSPADEDKDSSSSCEEEEDEEEEDSEDSSIPSNDCRKDIMVGPQYQAAIPPLGVYSCQERAYENEDQLLWDPRVLPEEEVVRFLLRAERQGGEEGGPTESATPGTLIKDNEQALYELVKCSFSREEALRRLHFNVKVFRDKLCAWSEEECRNFEHGYRVHGKNFHLIQANKVRTRSVGECVQYYYMWKKSDRHEYFTQQTSKMSRKKYSLQAGTLDDAEQDGEGGEGDGGGHARNSPPEPSATPQLDPPSPQDSSHPRNPGAEERERERGREGSVEESVLDVSGAAVASSFPPPYDQLGASPSCTPPPPEADTNCSSPPSCPQTPLLLRPDTPTPPKPELLTPGYYQLQLGPLLMDTLEAPPSPERLKVSFSCPESFPEDLPLPPSQSEPLPLHPPLPLMQPSTPTPPPLSDEAPQAQVSLSVTTGFGSISVANVSDFLNPHPVCPPPSALQHSQSLSQ